MNAVLPSASGLATQSGDLTSQYLTFLLGREVFALDIEHVREIIQYTSMTVVPLMPEFVRGVINLRGSVVPVIDLQVRFGRARAQVGAKTCIIIFDVLQDGNKSEFGLMVDAVSEVIEIAQTLIQSPPHFGTSIRRDFIRAMGKVDGQFVIILEPRQAFDIDDMARLTEQAHKV